MKAPDSLKLFRTIQINKQVSKRGKSQLSPLKTFSGGITPGSLGCPVAHEPGVKAESHPGPFIGALLNVQVKAPPQTHLKSSFGN